MQDFLSQFHFLRPYWLLAIIPAIGLAILLWRHKRSISQWQTVIQPELLRHLLEGSLSQRSRWQFTGLVAGWIIAAIALAGPAWQRLPQPVHQSEAAVVILFDMSPSMVAEDLKPSRLQQARFKLRDYLGERVDGLTALVAYAGEAHVVSPLTDDTTTIANLLPALHPGMMPLTGSNVEMAVDKALRLFTDAGMDRGDILLVTDGVIPEAFPTLRQKLLNSNVRLSVLGVGTPEGAPIPTGDGGFARGQDNDIVIAKLNNRELRKLSGELGGTYAGLSTDSRDIEHLLAHSERQEKLNRQQRLVEREFDSWKDNGQWLALLLLPFVALGFRRGWLLTFGLVAFAGALMPQKSYALDWQDLWLRSDQQGLRQLEKGNPEAAASEFESHDWRGTAHYRGENYPAAAEAFARGNSATDDYNRGNSLARSGKLQDALGAYEQALKKKPDFTDAEFNADLVRKLLEQQQKQEQSGSNPRDQEQQDQEQSGNEQQNAQDSQKGQKNNDQQQAQGQQSESGQDKGQRNPDAESADSQSGEESVNEEAAQQLADRQSEDKEDGEEREQPAPARTQAADETEPQGEDQSATALADSNQTETSEEQQALEQWLRQVPDDPSGLLRRKFEYEHRKMRQQYRAGDWLPPENQSYKRW